MAYTTRFSGGKGGRNGLESELRHLSVTQKNTRPNHPTTTRKVERFQQTMKRWLAAQPDQPEPIDELQALLDVFVTHYNDERPHRSLPERSVPSVAYRARPKATPDDGSDDTHDRVRRDVVDKAGRITLRVGGRLHHIGLGRTLARTPVIVLVHDLEVRVVHAATGELIRSLVIDPSKDYQATGAPKGPTRPPRPPS